MNLKYGGGSERLSRFEEMCDMFKTEIQEKHNVVNLNIVYGYLITKENQASMRKLG